MLSELHQRILGHDPELAVRPPGQRPGGAAPPDTLPPETAEFVGRHEERGLLTGGAHSLPRAPNSARAAGPGKTPAPGPPAAQHVREAPRRTRHPSPGA